MQQFLFTEKAFLSKEMTYFHRKLFPLTGYYSLSQDIFSIKGNVFVLSYNVTNFKCSDILMFGQVRMTRVLTSSCMCWKLCLASHAIKTHPMIDSSVEHVQLISLSKFSTSPSSQGSRDQVAGLDKQKVDKSIRKRMSMAKAQGGAA